MIDEKKLRFWCQTVLPLVYDDSLSYYELLNKVVKYLNNTIEDVEELADSFEDLSSDVTGLEATVGQFDQRITNNAAQIEILDGRADSLQENTRKTLTYRGLTIKSADLSEVTTGAVQARYFSGYYTPQVGQGGLPSSETITANNQYRYLIAVINNFEADPFDTDDRSNRTWLLYGPNAKMWWSFGETPNENTWFVFDPSAIDVSEIQDQVDTLSTNFEELSDFVNTLSGRVTNVIRDTNEIRENAMYHLEDLTGKNAAYIRTAMNDAGIFYVTYDSSLPGSGWTNGLLISRGYNVTTPAVSIAVLLTDSGEYYIRKATEENGWTAWIDTQADYYKSGEIISNLYGWAQGGVESTSIISFTIPCPKVFPNAGRCTINDAKLGLIYVNGWIDNNQWGYDFLADSDYTVNAEVKAESNLVYVQIRKTSGTFKNYNTTQDINSIRPVSVWINSFDLTVR